MDYTIAFKLNCWSTIGRLLNQYGDHFTRALCRLKKKLWEEVCEVVIPDWNELGAQEKTKQGKSNGMSAIN